VERSISDGHVHVRRTLRYFRGFGKGRWFRKIIWDDGNQSALRAIHEAGARNVKLVGLVQHNLFPKIPLAARAYAILRGVKLEPRMEASVILPVTWAMVARLQRENPGLAEKIRDEVETQRKRRSRHHTPLSVPATLSHVANMESLSRLGIRDSRIAYVKELHLGVSGPWQTRRRVKKLVDRCREIRYKQVMAFFKELQADLKVKFEFDFEDRKAISVQPTLYNLANRLFSGKNRDLLEKNGIGDEKALQEKLYGLAEDPAEVLKKYKKRDLAGAPPLLHHVARIFRRRPLFLPELFHPTYHDLLFAAKGLPGTPKNLQAVVTLNHLSQSGVVEMDLLVMNLLGSMHPALFCDAVEIGDPQSSSVYERMIRRTVDPLTAFAFGSDAHNKLRREKPDWEGVQYNPDVQLAILQRALELYGSNLFATRLVDKLGILRRLEKAGL
jgi:hypothetical protein